MKMRLIRSLSFALLMVGLVPLNANAQTDLVSKAKQEQSQQSGIDSTRQASFNKTKRELMGIRAELEKQKAKIQSQTDKLTAKFAQNEVHLAKLEDKLRAQSASLGELFGVVRQNAKELKTELHHSVTGVDANRYSAVVDQIVAAKTLPSISQLTGLWNSFREQIKAGGELAQVNVPYVQGSGVVKAEPALRIGALGLVNRDGYLRWNDKTHEASLYPRQPEGGPDLSSLNPLIQGKLQSVVLDPSRGSVLVQLAEEPTFSQRLAQGGVIGEVIIVILIVGLVIALVRGISLFRIHRQIRQQLSSPETPTDNPLGRVISVYQQEPNRSVEALELRLLEAIVDEQSHLEKGLSMLKLFAAIAPMLGLLGTVTGMIETFQMITQFGNGDPKVMAGGISMALVTTVLGLVSAIPILLAHNILSTQAESIRSILEKQGIGIVAQQAELDKSVVVAGNMA